MPNMRRNPLRGFTAGRLRLEAGPFSALSAMECL